MMPPTPATTLESVGRPVVGKKKQRSVLGKYARFFYNGVTRSAPVQVTLFVTSRCNIRCKMCFYWEPVESKATGEVSLDEIEKISKSMPPFFWLLIGGGEPFVRKDLPQIVKFFYDNNGIRHLSIPTNATYPDQTVAVLREMLTACPDLFVNVNLSLNGIGHTHDELCKSEGVFEKLLVTYARLVELKKEYKNFGLGMNMTHSKYSEEELEKVIDFMASDLPGVDNISLGLVRGRPKQKTALDVDLNRYKSAVEKIESLAVQRKIRTFNTVMGGLMFAKDMIMRRLIVKTVKSGYQIPCLAGKISLVIDEKTNVYPCEMLSSVGNLRSNGYDMRKILNGKVLQAAVKKIKCENCYCTHECSYSTNILFNYRSWLTIVRCYAVFRFKRLLNADHIFETFDSLNLPSKPTINSQHDGQGKELYEGTTFGVLVNKPATLS